MARRRPGWIAALVLLLVGGAALWWWRGRDGGDVAGAAAGRDAGPGRAGAGDERARLLPEDPHGAARARLTGTVRDAAGAPLAGALVCATAWSAELSREDTREPRCTTSGADGRYAIGELFAASYAVGASLRGHLPSSFGDTPAGKDGLRLAAGETRNGVDLVLAAGGVEVVGVVKDSAGGFVAGAWVRVSAGRFGQGSTARTRSEADGSFRAWVREGGVRATAEADGYAPGGAAGVAPGRTLEILLTPEAVLVGRVVEAGSGAPVAGARVSPDGVGEGARGGGFRGGWDGNGQAISDADGRFRITRLEPGRYKPSARALGRVGVAAESVQLGLGQTSDEVVIEVHPAQVVSGVIVDGGTPCVDGTVELDDCARQRRASGASDENGRVTLRAVLPGTYAVSVSCEGFPERQDFKPLVVADRDITDERWELRAGFTVRGVVVEAGGAGVPGVDVWGEVKTADPRAPRSFASGDTDQSGRFELRGVSAGTLELEILAREHPAPAEPTKVPVAGDVDGVRIVVEASGSLEGTVRDESGAPVGGVGVSAAGKTRDWWSGQTTTRDDGGYTMRGLRPGEYRVSASGAGFERLRAPGTGDDDVQGTTATVVAGKAARVDLRVEARRGVITGRVVDSQGAAITDAFVDAERESESAGAQAGGARRSLRWTWRRQPALTDTDGSFRVEKLARGSYTVRAYRKGGGEAFADGVAVGGTVTLTILAPGSVAGVVTLEGGGAPEEISVDVRNRKTGFQRDEDFFRTGGRFVIRDLPAGEFQLSVTAAEGTATLSVTLAQGEARGDLRLVLAPRTVLRGTVVAFDTGAPLAGMRVMARPLKGGGGMSFGGSEGARKHITDASGRYELENAPTGRLWMLAMPEDFAASSHEMGRLLVDVKPGATGDLPPIRAMPRRLKSGEEGGDLGFGLKESPPDVEPEQVVLVVAVVRPGGPAAAAGLTVGDQIVSVDGHDVTAPNTHRYRSLATTPEGTIVTLGVKRAGAAEPVAVPIKAGKPTDR